MEDEYINGTEIKINKHDYHSLVRTRTEQLIVRFYPNHSDESPTATDKFLFHWNQQQIYMLNYKNIPLLSHDGIFLSIALNEQNPILFLRKRLDGIDLIVHLQGVRKNEWLDINDIVKINDQITVEIYDTQRNNDIIVNGVSLSQIIGNMIWNSIVSRGEMIANYSIKDSEHSSNIRLAMKYPNPKQSS